MATGGWAAGRGTDAQSARSSGDAETQCRETSEVWTSGAALECGRGETDDMCFLVRVNRLWFGSRLCVCGRTSKLPEMSL